MMLPKIRLPRKVTQKIGEVTFKIGRKKPELCLITGIFLGGGALIMTVVETWNNKEKLENDIGEIKSLSEYKPDEDNNERKKQVRQSCLRFGIDICKVYWKPALMGSGALVLIITSHKMLRRSLAEMTAMYAGLLESYRQLAAENGKTETKEIEIIDAETGEITKKTVETNKPYHSPYAVWYDEGIFDDEKGCWIWRNSLYRDNKQDFEINLKCAQNECNDTLRARGYMFLNEVRDKLNLPPIPEGQHLGWVRSGLINGKGGDDYIDFGVFPDYMNGRYQLPVNKEFLDPKSNQRIPLIDFNCTCIDAIFDDIYEYHNYSGASFDRRRKLIKGKKGSEEDLDRWFQQNEMMERNNMRGRYL